MAKGFGSDRPQLGICYDVRGQRHQMGLGSVNTIDLAIARVKARACRQVLLDGKDDPLAERRAARTSYAHQEAKRITFDQCAAAYIDVVGDVVSGFCVVDILALPNPFHLEVPEAALVVESRAFVTRSSKASST